MIDWHTHILPAMDDGSRDVAESLSMLRMQMEQGVRTVIATPHFYANDETVQSFLDRRQKAWDALKAELPQDAPEIRLGAEVRYYQGISHMAELRELRLEGSKLLLLEMPMSTWSEYMLRELTELSGKSGIRLILAHVDRYFHLQKQAVWDRIYDCGILMQGNASAFTAFASKRKMISLLQEGRIQFVGSDCHNLKSRPPQIAKAFAAICKKLGEDYLHQMNDYGHTMLAETINSEL